LLQALPVHPNIPCHTEIRITAAQGLSLEPGRAERIKFREPEDENREPSKTAPAESARLPARADFSAPAGLTLATDQADYAATVQVRKVPVPPQVEAIMMVDREGDAIVFRATVQLQASLGELREVDLDVSRWKGMPLRLDAPRALKEVRRQSRGTLGWHIQLPHGITRPYTLRLSGRLTSGGGNTWELPDLHVKGASWAGRWLVVGRALRVAETNALTPLTKLPPPLATGLFHSESRPAGGAIWTIAGQDWRCRLRKASAATTPALNVLWVEQTATPVEQERWLHERNYILAVDRPSTVTLTLPDRVRLVAAALNGRPVALQAVSSGELDISLTDSLPVQHLSLRWLLPAAVEPFRQPVLTGPRLKGVDGSPVLWALRVPVSWRITPPDAKKEPGALSTSAADLRRADALLAISELLAMRIEKKPSPQLVSALLAAQKAFARHCLQIAQRLELKTSAGAEEDQNQLRAELTRRRTANEKLARKYQFSKLRNQATHDPFANPGTWFDSAALPATARSQYWYGNEQTGTPAPRLVSHAQERFTERARITEMLLLALILGWVFAAIPVLAVLLRWTWPEQLLVLGAIAWLCFGPSLLGIVLLLIVILGRIGLTVSWLRRLLTPRATPAGAGGTSAV
jgi:hypothetical protein